MPGEYLKRGGTNITVVSFYDSVVSVGSKFWQKRLQTLQTPESLQHSLKIWRRQDGSGATDGDLGGGVGGKGVERQSWRWHPHLFSSIMQERPLPLQLPIAIEFGILVPPRFKTNAPKACIWRGLSSSSPHLRSQ
ncbi:hypothetical protein CEXT_257001 [Caerostris extrusa]|uniref:Uncharacterized protein n=1 Tax=Caerostris extrusa TaxID=172846 RepID=A0AAV4VL38_CAEEX|nr:hypothetical protein CEXT_257001 [Caerostris extrusa]